MANIKIIKKEDCTKIYIDGIEVKGVTKYELSEQAGKMPELNLSLIATEIDIETPCIPKLPDIYKPFYESKAETLADAPALQ